MKGAGGRDWRDIHLSGCVFATRFFLPRYKHCKFTYNNAQHINMALTQQPAVCLFDFAFLFRFLFLFYFIYEIPLFSIYPMMVSQSLPQTLRMKANSFFLFTQKGKRENMLSLNDFGVEREIRFYYSHTFPSLRFACRGCCLPANTNKV